MVRGFKKQSTVGSFPVVTNDVLFQGSFKVMLRGTFIPIGDVTRPTAGTRDGGRPERGMILNEKETNLLREHLLRIKGLAYAGVQQVPFFQRWQVPALGDY